MEILLRKHHRRPKVVTARPPGYPPPQVVEEPPPVAPAPPAQPLPVVVQVCEDEPQPLPKAEPVAVVDVTAVIVNFKTLDLVRVAHESLSALYVMPIILVDNASGDSSTEWIRERGGILNSKNIGHGPALHQAIAGIRTRYVLTFDSDCVARKPGFIEGMLAYFTDPLLYAVGWLRYVDRWSGVPLEWHLVHPPKEQFVGYIHPSVALYDLEKYCGMRPFSQHGAPALENMIDAEVYGYKVQAFPVFDYVTHLEAGTRRMYDGRWDPTEKEQPKPWKADARFPI